MKRETICLIFSLSDIVLVAGIMNWRMKWPHAELGDAQQSLAKEVFVFMIAESDSANDQKNQTESAGCGF